MAKRRGHNEGSVFKRESDGRWCAEVFLGYHPETGKPIRKRFYRSTRREAERARDAALRALEAGRPVQGGRQTVGEYLQEWLRDVAPLRLRPKTLQVYGYVVRVHIVPHIGRIQIGRLTPQDVQRMLGRVGTTVAPGTVRRVHAVLSVALNQALKWELVERNVAGLVDVPRVPVVEQRALTPIEARAFLASVAGQRYEALYHLALHSGMRQGELLGLRWQDVDLDAGRLTVSQTLASLGGRIVFGEPKTAKSRRTLPLVPATVQVLRAHRARQLHERLRAGVAWEGAAYDLVWCSHWGTPIDPRNLVRAFKGELLRAGLPPIRFHDLRHSCASLLADAGVPQRVVMEILGHSDIRLTSNLYTHVYEPAKTDAAEALARLLAGDREAM